MKKMKKILISTIAASLCVAVPVSSTFSTNQIVEAQTTELSGEEIFKGFVFGQGELGENLPNIFSENMLDELNSEEMKEFADLIVKRISAEDPKLFDELKDAVYNKDPQKVDELLAKSGKIIESDMKKPNKELKNVQQAAQRAGFETQNETYLYYYYIAAAGAVVLVILTQIDITPVTAGDDFNREAAISSLIEEVN